MSEKELSERAKARLKIAAGLLRGTGKGKKELPISREGFYPGIQGLINALPPDEKQQLKDCTDWVEKYDNAYASISTQNSSDAQGA